MSGCQRTFSSLSADDISSLIDDIERHGQEHYLEDILLRQVGAICARPDAAAPTTITVPANLEARWGRVIERVAEKMGYSIEEAREMIARTVVSRGIEHLERIG